MIFSRRVTFDWCIKVGHAGHKTIDFPFFQGTNQKARDDKISAVAAMLAAMTGPHEQRRKKG